MPGMVSSLLDLSRCAASRRLLLGEDRNQRWCSNAGTLFAMEMGEVTIMPGISETELSPLDQIRQTEADVTRQIAAAREAAERSVAEARREVKTLLGEARESGRRRGQVRYKEIISRAEEESQAFVSQAHNQAERLRYTGRRRMSTAVRQAVNVVIGLPDDGAEE
jgi:vacuolar-type H+-ATPase subunit H